MGIHQVQNQRILLKFLDKNVKKKRKARRLALEKRLAKLEGLISSNSSRDLLEEYSKCNSDLESMHNYITAGIILRSKSEWYEHGKNLQNTF